MNELINIENRILVIRGQHVMLDRDLAVLYGVETKRLNEAVKRNKERFPDRFCFQLDKNEFNNWKSQFATSNSDKISLIKYPMRSLNKVLPCYQQYCAVKPQSKSVFKNGGSYE